MASPPEAPFLFASESAMDELAVALEHQPARAAPAQRHDPQADRGLPYINRSLIPCFIGDGTGWPS